MALELDINELKQKRAKIVEEMRALHSGMVERGGETGEETEKFEKILSYVGSARHMASVLGLIFANERPIFVSPPTGDGGKVKIQPSLRSPKPSQKVYEEDQILL